jgi:hypothetical protein
MPRRSRSKSPRSKSPRRSRSKSPRSKSPRRSRSRSPRRSRSRSSSGVSESEIKRKYHALKKGGLDFQNKVIERRVKELEKEIGEEKAEDVREFLDILMYDFVRSDDAESHVTTKSFFTSKTHTPISIIKGITGQVFTIEKMVRDV